MELGELVRGAQDAMDRGDYRLATAASAHGLAAYPSCLAAHRILGEAHLELGDARPATDHFEQTLAVDPLNVVARLGLGVASEEQKDYAAAYAHYLHAWEINPALDQVRDELVRLRGLLGVEDRLHPTRAGLAGIHARGGQLQRAANEWRAVLAVEPESRRARTSFAELLWRQGEDALAAVACRDALRGSPENARALAILADVERRRQGPGADEFAGRYRAVDPTGDVLKLLGEWRADVDLGFLAVETAPVDDFDFAAHAVPSAQLGVAPKIVTNALAGNQIAAPDLWDTLVKDLSIELPSTGVAPTLASGVEPFTWNDAGPEGRHGDQFADLGIQPFNVDDLGAGGSSNASYFTLDEPAASPADPSTADIYTAALSRDVVAPPVPQEAAEQAARREADEHDDLAALFAPATNQEIAAAMPVAAGVGAEVGAQGYWGGSGDTSAKTGGSATGAGGYDDDDLVDLGLEPFSFDGMEDRGPGNGVQEPVAPLRQPTPPASPSASLGAPPTPPAPVFPTPALDAVAPSPTQVAAKTVPPVFVDPFVTADGSIDLTRGWDDLDRSLAAATPSVDADGRYDDLAAELGVDGIVPFDANIPGQDEDAWAPLTEDDFNVAVAAPVAQVAAAEQVAAEPTYEPTVSAPTPAEWLTPSPALEADWTAPAPAPAPSPSTEVDWSSLGSAPGVEVDWSSLDAVAPMDAGWVGPSAAPSAADWDAPAQAASAADWPGDATDSVLDLSALDALMAFPEVGPTSTPPASDTIVAADSSMPEEVASAADGVSAPTGFDDEVMFGIPSQQSSGYTELLRHVDDEEPDEVTSSGTGIDPYRNPDSNGEPLAFEDLLAVTSRDGTAPLVARGPVETDDGLSPFDFSETDLASAVPADDQIAGHDLPDLDLEGLDPFNLDELAAIPEASWAAEEPPLDTSDVIIEPAAFGDGRPRDAVGSLVDGLAPFDFEAALAEPDPVVPVVPAIVEVVAVAADTPAAASAPEWSGAAGLGMAIGSVIWPAFVNQTSDLIDRDRGDGSVFTRLRASKAALVAAGELVVDRRLATVPALVADAPRTADARRTAGSAPAADPAAPARARPVMSEQTRLDLMAMRVRLIEDADAAEEIARTVEKAVGEGLCEPLALRILGEAYLKLGRMEQAAAQFRQAMLARQRTR